MLTNDILDLFLKYAAQKSNQMWNCKQEITYILTPQARN